MEFAARKLFMPPDYCEHFGLSRVPFNDAVNPEFFYRTETHEAAFVRTMICAQSHRALGLIWGRSGTGKTLLAQMLLSVLSEREFLPVMILGNPGMSKMGLLESILDELEVSASPGRSNTQVLINRIHSFLMEAYSVGKRVVVIVDEAHFLAADQLHMIRALTNLETPHEKLCTIIMLAEEAFPRRLRHKRYNSLRGRISMASYLMPMSRSETEQYMKFRLMVAGATEELFDQEGYDLIHAYSGGICREVSKLADSALLGAYMRGDLRVSREVITDCIQNSI